MTTRRFLNPHIAFLAALTLVQFAAPTRIQAQEDRQPLHATLRGWADDMWLRVGYRSAATGGRMSELGILQRFHPIAGSNYEIDVISNRFPLSEDYAWYTRDRGFRWGAGSVTTRDLAEWVEFKARVPINQNWNANIRYSREGSLEADGTILRVDIRHSWSNGIYSYVGSNLVKNKADIDLTFGGGWRSTGSTPIEVDVAVGALDLFNDHLFGFLGIDSRVVDTAIAYDEQQLIAKVSTEFELGGKLRVETYAGIMPPSTMRAFVQSAPDSGFIQTERFGYAGTLLEWTFTPRARAGVMVNHVTARIERRQLTAGSGLPGDNFTRTERETTAGTFVLARLSPRWVLEAWLARNWRPELKRAATGFTLPEVDFEDRAWSGSATFTYGRLEGFSAILGMVIDHREVLRGSGELQTLGSLSRANTRARMDFGWRLPGGYFYIGTAFDVDTPNSLFIRGTPDGYRARFVVDF